MPIIPMPIFIPDDGNSPDLIIPDAVGFILFGGIITAILGVIMALVAVSVEIVFDKELDLLYKVAAVVAIVGLGAALIGLVLTLITGETVDG